MSNFVSMSLDLPQKQNKDLSLDSVLLKTPKMKRSELGWMKVAVKSHVVPAFYLNAGAVVLLELPADIA